MKATEQYFTVVLFIMLYKVVLTFESVDEILKRDHSNESYWAVPSCATVYDAVLGEHVNEIPIMFDHSTESYWTILYFPLKCQICALEIKGQ